MGEFVRYPGIAEPINAAQLLVQPLSCDVMRKLFFDGPEVAKAGVTFRVTMKCSLGDGQDSILISQDVIDTWAERVFTSGKLPISFTVHWSFEFPVYWGVPVGQHPLATVRYQSSCLVRDFVHSVKKVACRAMHGRKGRVVAYDFAYPRRTTPLTDAVLGALPVIVVLECEDYARLDVASIEGHVLFGHGPYPCPSESYFRDCDPDASLSTGVANFLADHNRKDALDACIARAVGLLNSVASTFDISSCYNCTTRRTVIDIIQYSATAFSGKHCKVGTPAKLEYPDGNEYIGTGLLDYFVGGLVPVVGRIVPDTLPPERGDYLDAEEADELHIAVTEARGRLFMRFVAQLVAQLLDQLKSGALSRKRCRAGDSDPTPARTIRGILSTGQKFLFFALKETATDIPELVYYGSWTLNILPGQRVGARYTVDQVTGAATPEKPVDEGEVKQLLAAYAVFLSGDV